MEFRRWHLNRLKCTRPTCQNKDHQKGLLAYRQKMLNSFQIKIKEIYLIRK